MTQYPQTLTCHRGTHRMPPICHEESWRVQFDRLYELRNLWNPDKQADQRAFKISVAARMCPIRPLGGINGAPAPDDIAAPKVTVSLSCAHCCLNRVYLECTLASSHHRGRGFVSGPTAPAAANCEGGQRLQQLGSLASCLLWRKHSER